MIYIVRIMLTTLLIAYNVRVPAQRTNSVGPDWTSGSTAGTTIPITQFYVVKSGDTAATINATLASGKNLLVTLGVHRLNAPLNITRPDTVALEPQQRSGYVPTPTRRSG